MKAKIDSNGKSKSIGEGKSKLNIININTFDAFICLEYEKGMKSNTFNLVENKEFSIIACSDVYFLSNTPQEIEFELY